jgi:hypothetical protein
MTARLGLVRAAALLIAAVAGLAAGLAGCGTNTGDGTRDLNPPSAATSSAATGHRLGEQVAAGTGFVVATAFGYNPPAATGGSPLPGGGSWASADVQACAQQGTVFPVSVSDGTWSLRLADGTAAGAWHGDDPAFPQPRYAETPTSLQAGQCLRGWVVFQVPANGLPQLVRYSPQGAEPIDWLLG